MKRPTTEEPFRKSYQIIKKPTTAQINLNRVSNFNNKSAFEERRLSYNRPKTMGSKKP